MKRNLLILLAIVLMNCDVMFAQTTIWSSDCENLVGWSGDDIDGDGSNWFYYSGGETFGFETGRFYGSPSQAASPDNALFTPDFFIPNNVEGITFTMRVASSNASNYSESYAVFIQDVNSGGTYDNMLFQETLTQGGPSSARDVTITIPNSFMNKTVKLIVRHYNCSNQDFLLIDDFKVEYTNTLSTENNEFVDFSMFPNPVINQLSFKTNEPITKIKIFNIVGKEVMSLNEGEIFNNKIDVSNLATGSYLINIQINNTNKTYKLIKK